MKPEKDPCQCRHEIDNNLKRTKFCLRPCLSQREWRKCLECDELHSTAEVRRVYGVESSVFRQGFCSAKCYTDNTMKKINN